MKRRTRLVWALAWVLAGALVVVFCPLMAGGRTMARVCEKYNVFRFRDSVGWPWIHRDYVVVWDNDAGPVLMVVFMVLGVLLFGLGVGSAIRTLRESRPSASGAK